MDRAVEEVKYRMSRYGVSPNVLIIPPQLSLYLAMAPDAKTLYPEGGTKAVSEFESGRAGFESRSFRGLNVLVSEPFEVADGEPTDLNTFPVRPRPESMSTASTRAACRPIKRGPYKGWQFRVPVSFQLAVTRQ